MRNRLNALLLSAAVHLVLILVASLFFDTVRASRGTSRHRPGNAVDYHQCAFVRKVGDLDNIVCEFGAVIHLESRWRGWRRDFTEKSLDRHVRYAETRGLIICRKNDLSGHKHSSVTVQTSTARDRIAAVRVKVICNSKACFGVDWRLIALNGQKRPMMIA